jgi:hypothetical protein
LIFIISASFAFHTKEKSVQDGTDGGALGVLGKVSNSPKPNIDIIA